MNTTNNGKAYLSAIGFILVAGFLYIAGGYMADKAIAAFKSTLPTA